MRKFSIAAGVAGLITAAIAPCAFAAGPYIYVANAGEDTVSKIDVTGSGTEVARYPTWFTSGTSPNYFAHLGNSHAGAAPSRITQDSFGYIYVLDRFFSKYSYYYGGASSPNQPHLPVLIKMTQSPSGATSSGSTVIPMLDGNNNYDIDSNEITDTAIVWAKPVGMPGTNLNASCPIYKDELGLGRALAIDRSNNLWVGIFGDTTSYPNSACSSSPATAGVLKSNTAHYYKYNSSGGFLAGPINTQIGTQTHTPYGAQVDINGKLWSVDEGHTLAEIDTGSNTLVAIHDHSSYGLNYSLAVYNDCSTSPPTVKVYLSQHNPTPPSYPPPPPGKTYIVYDPQAPPATAWSTAPPGVPQFASYSVAVDSKGNIFSGALYTGEVVKVLPNGTLKWSTSSTAGAGPTQPTTNLHGLIVDKNDDVWAVDLAGSNVYKYDGVSGKYLGTVKVGDSPYTYGNPPPPTCAGSPTPTPTPTPVISPTPTPTPTPSGCAEVAGEVRCQRDGNYSYTFAVKNNSGNSASQILLTPAQGSTFTLTPQLTNLSSPLNNGQSTSITTTIEHVKLGDKICFFVSLMSEKAQCCIVQVCLTLPSCGDVTPTPSPTPTPTATVMQPPDLRQMQKGRRRP